MKTIGISEDGESLALAGGSLFADGREAAAVIVRSRLRLLKGECAEDPGLGLDFRETDGALMAAGAKSVIALSTNGQGVPLVSSMVVTGSQVDGQLRLDVSIEIDDVAAGLEEIDTEDPAWGATTWAGSMWL